MAPLIAIVSSLPYKPFHKARQKLSGGRKHGYSELHHLKWVAKFELSIQFTCWLGHFHGCQAMGRLACQVGISSSRPPFCPGYTAVIQNKSDLYNDHKGKPLSSTWSSLDWFHTLWGGKSPVQYTQSNWIGNGTTAYWTLNSNRRTSKGEWFSCALTSVLQQFSD